MKNTPIYMTAALTIDESTELTLPRKFSGIGYSGGIVSEWGERIVVDLDTATVSQNMPLLLQHDHEHVIGVIKSAVIANGALSVSGELFSDIDGKAASVAQKAQRGAAYQMSIGLFDCSRDMVAMSNEIVAVNGQSFTAPLTILRNGNIREVSIVALGADANTNVNIFGKQTETDIKETHIMADKPQDTPEIAALKEEIAKLKEENKAAKVKLEAQATATRTEDIKQLFATCKEELSESTTTHFLSMTQEQFSATADFMKNLAAKKAPDLTLNPALFSVQVTDGQSDDKAKPQSYDAFALNKQHSKGV